MQLPKWLPPARWPKSTWILRGAFDEAASDDADVGDHETAPPAAEPTYRAAEPAAGSADPLELGLEEELNAMLDDAHAEPEPQVAA